VGLTKGIIDHSLNQDLNESQEEEVTALISLLDSPDLVEAINSYMEKRSPHFVGK
jgi:hypothetical protein